MWGIRGSILVSECRWEMGDIWVQPVMILRALFCRVCSLFRLVGETRGDQAGEAYSMRGLMYCLYRRERVSLS